MKTIKCGVPQGSILGPLLFLIYINDLVSVCKNSSPFLFADDTNLFINGTNLQDMTNKINAELHEISKWLKVNKLSLNVKKTHFMVFTSRKCLPEFFDIHIDGYGIERVKHTKFLGVFIDDKLSWKKHISYISSKISRGIGIIVKARKLLSLNALKTLYFSFIYPYYTYCNQVWGSACDSYLHPLVILQKRCIRIITLSKAREHTDPLFTKLGLLKLFDINRYLICKFMYRWYHNDLPTLFRDIFTTVSDIHDHNTRQNTHLYCSSFNTCLGKTKFSYRAPRMWNLLLKAKINPDTSECVFAKTVKQCIKVGIL